MSVLTHKGIRQVVQTFAPETLDTYDMLTGKPLPTVNGNPPMEWTNEMRSEVALHLWNRYDPSRPN